MIALRYLLFYPYLLLLVLISAKQCVAVQQLLCFVLISSLSLLLFSSHFVEIGLCYMIFNIQVSKWDENQQETYLFQTQKDLCLNKHSPKKKDFEKKKKNNYTKTIEWTKSVSGITTRCKSLIQLDW